MPKIIIRRKTGKVLMGNKETGEFLIVEPRLSPLFFSRGQKRYGFAGGGIKNGETPEAAALREIREETGIIHPHPETLVRLADDYDSRQDFLIFTIENRTTLFLILFDKKPEIRLNWELSGFLWVELEEMEKFLSPYYENLFKAAVKNNNEIFREIPRSR